MENSKDDDQKYDWMSADEKGHFSLQGFEGAEYWVHASVNTSRMKTSSGKDLWDTGTHDLNAKPINVNVSKTNEPLRIVIPLPQGVEKPKKRPF